MRFSHRPTIGVAFIEKQPVSVAKSCINGTSRRTVPARNAVWTNPLLLPTAERRRAAAIESRRHGDNLREKSPVTSPHWLSMGDPEWLWLADR